LFSAGFVDYVGSFPSSSLETVNNTVEAGRARDICA
jgi:hypothetical protein